MESTSAHPGGIQIYNNILAVGFSTGSNSSKINFYDLTNPVSPVLAGSYNAPVKTICLGLTGYEDKYLVAQYYGRTGRIRFYHFDQSFNKIDEQVWLATEQDKSDWYPSSSWKDHTPDYYGYENMNLVISHEQGASNPSYTLFMYHNSNAIDVFSLSEPNLSDPIDLQMIYSLDCTPWDNGFRYAAGMEIVDNETLRFFSALKHVHSSVNANVISLFKPKTNWPWQLSYDFGTGGEQDIALDDNGNCIEIHRGSAGGSNEYKLYYHVGSIDASGNQVVWESAHNTGLTGEFASIAMGTNGSCVAVHRGTGSSGNKLYYRVGQLNAVAKTVSWGTTQQYASGGDMAIAMDDNNHIVEVHRGSTGGVNETNHYYRVGTVDTGSKTISWVHNEKFQSGGNLSVAIDNYGNCLTTYRGTPGSAYENIHFYRVGSINYSSGIITWGDSVQYDTGGNLDITMDDHGKCLDVHRGSPGGSNENKHYYRFGHINFGTKTITWDSSASYDVGGSVSVSMDNNGRGIVVHLGEEGTSDSNVRYSRLMKFSVAGIPSSDTDSDGIPDWWEALFTGNPTSMERDGHSDGDGITNYEEWLADTVPTNTESYFSIMEWMAPTSVVFSSSLYRQYSVECRTDLMNTNESWKPKVEWFAGSGSLSVLDFAEDPTNRYYRIRTRLP